jgi:PAS domain S-box-containing protein
MNKNIYSLAFMRAHDIILIADCNNKIIDANPAACDAFGYSKEVLLTMDISQVFFDQKVGHQFLKDICKTNLMVELREYEFRTKDATPFPVLVNADKLDEEAEVLMVVAKDVTSYKKQKENHFTKKEMMVIGKMAQNVAHDLKNPLNNIFLGLHQFRSILPEDNEEVLFYLNFLEKNSRRLNDLISSSLSPEAILQLRKEQLDLNELVNEAAKNAEDKIQMSNIILNLDLADQPFHFDLDREKMLMALDNLIVNAIESVQEDDGIIYIKTGQKNGKAALVISDNGHGIPASDLKNIYDPYFSTKSKKMGLGLTNTEQILNAHEVEMEVQSEIGKGSTFTLYF